MADEQLTFRPAGKTDASGDITFHTGDWRVEGWDSGTPAYRDELVTSADQDGAALSRVARREAVEWSIRLRLVTQGSTDTMLSKLRALDEALGTAERAYADGIDDPGVDAARLLWRPADASTTGILPLLRAEIAERPISMEGDGIGWFIKTPVVTVTGLRDPFIYGDLAQVKQENSSGTPLAQVVDVPAVGGTVPPWMKVTVEDKASKNRGQLTAGMEWPAETDALVVAATSLSVSGLEGSIGGGRMSVNTGTWATAAQYAASGLSNRQGYRVIACGVTGGGSIRLRAGETFQGMSANVEVNSNANFYTDLDLGVVARPAGGIGLLLTLETVGNVSLAGLVFVPLSAWMKLETPPQQPGLGARGAISDMVDSYVNLSGKALQFPSGQTWSVSGGTWNANPEGGWRGMTGEGSLTWATAGVNTFTGVRVEAYIRLDAGIPDPWVVQGLVARRSGNGDLLFYRHCDGSNNEQYVFSLNYSGTRKYMWRSAWSPRQNATWIRLAVEVDTEGFWWVYQGVGLGGGLSMLRSGWDPRLATGGLLASGTVGLADQCSWTGGGPAPAIYRYYRDFNATTLTAFAAAPAVQSGRLTRFTPARTVSESKVLSSPVFPVEQSPRGGMFTPPPDRASRLVVMTRRNQHGAATAAEHLVDSQQVTVSARKRWLSVP